MEECIFCKIAEKKIPATVVYESDTVMAFQDIMPVAPTHVVIIPKKHIETLWDAQEADMGVLGEIQQVAVKLAHQLNLQKGFRLVSNCNEQGGQTVFHIHYHLLGGRMFQWPPG